MPHLSDSITSLTQSFGIRWGAYRFLISCSGIRSSGIASVELGAGMDSTVRACTRLTLPVWLWDCRGEASRCSAPLQLYHADPAVDWAPGAQPGGSPVDRLRCAHCCRQYLAAHHVQGGTAAKQFSDRCARSRCSGLFSVALHVRRYGSGLRYGGWRWFRLCSARGPSMVGCPKMPSQRLDNPRSSLRAPAAIRLRQW